MTGWGNDDPRNQDWVDYAAHLRGEPQKPAHQDPRWWELLDYVMAGVLGLCTAYAIAFVFVPFIRLLQNGAR